MKLYENPYRYRNEGGNKKQWHLGYKAGRKDAINCLGQEVEDGATVAYIRGYDAGYATGLVEREGN